MPKYLLVPVDGRCAGEKFDRRREEYNNDRTHSSLNDMTPAEFIRSYQKGQILLLIQGQDMRGGQHHDYPLFKQIDFRNLS